jgi:oligopeptidase B
MDALEEVIMDVNKEAKNYSFFKLGSFAISPCHNLLAYTVDTAGNEFFELRIRDLSQKKELMDVIPNVASRVVWLPNSQGFYYLTYNSNWRTKELFFHALGEDVKKDPLLYKETQEIPTLGLSQSFDKKYAFIESATKEDSEIYYIDLTSQDQSIKKLIDRQEKRLVSAEHKDGYFYLLMNDVGSNFRLVKRAVGDENLVELIPHNKDVYLTGLTPYAQGFVVTTRENGLDRIAVFDEEKKTFKYIQMQDPSYDLSLSPTTYDDSEIRYSYSSLSKPSMVLSSSFETDKTKVLKVQEIPSGFDPELYVSERIFAEARDGVKVPVSLVYRKDLFKEDGSNPLLLYGYGSYGYAIPASFNFRALSAVNKGFVYAIAHIRGGDDMGYDWYLQGKLLNKKNTFNDFIDSAEALIKKGYTQKGMISAMGGSAGGMLMGAVVNDRPDLFKAVIAHVPFVDVMNTMLDETLPLTPGEFVEWGNPKDKKYYDYMITYSPYDNVKKQAYPALFVTGGLTDPRVTYWEPTKWVAKLREFNQSKNPILLRMNMDAGHGGGSKRDEALKEGAQDLAFLMSVYGMV